ncbi:MAG: FGGY family carbohydrate kinase [Chthoniobacteraceae bacterium]
MSHSNPRLENTTISLGIDLGTQSVRAMAVSPSGEVLGLGAHPLTSHRDGARHEQEPEEWWTATVAACRAALADLPLENVRGVAVDATSGTVLLVDDGGRALTRGLMYDDTRAVAEVRRANEAGGAVWRRLGYGRMQAAWGLPKLLWLLREKREVVTRTTRLAHQSDFITRRLAGAAVATDASNALKTGCDLFADDWPHEVFEALGIPAELLPPVVRSGARLGSVGAAAAEATGIPAGAAIVAGMTDGCASQIGSGALRVGSWNSALGTTLVLKGVAPELIHDPLDVVYSHRAPDGGWLPGGASSVGAATTAWGFGGCDLDALSAEAAVLGPAGAVAYPLAGRGERFPFHAPDAAGFFLGDPRDELDRYAALLQGVAFIERLCFDYLDLLGAPTGGDLLLTGGGAKSRAWCQLRADILGRAVKIPENAEAALGMAVLAASDGRDVAGTAAVMVRIRETLDPQPERTRTFLPSYLRLVDELARRDWLAPNVALHAHTRGGLLLG